MSAVSRPVHVTRVHASRRDEADESVVVEEPLEIRVAGDVIATTMRTPGDDHLLALGFLLSEGVIARADDVGSVYPCGYGSGSEFATAIDVLPAPGVQLEVDRLLQAQRLGTPSSACGLCGRTSIDELLRRCTVRTTQRGSISRALLAQAPLLLADHQPAFARTGGLHAACAIRSTGEVVAHAEDVGRHNAVDKVLGRLLLSSVPRAEPLVLAVSGRAGFEIVQKALAYGFDAVASVSAPSSLAVEAAHAGGLTLAAFVREGRFTLYAHPERVDA